MSEFPRTAWQYHLRLRIEGTDRTNLPDCLVEEDLALFRYVSRADVDRQIADGELVFSQTLTAQLPGFADDLGVLSTYLFHVVKGLEVAQRWVSPTDVDQVRAWKVVARQGAWVRVPLVVVESPDDPRRFTVDPDAEDLAAIAAEWATCPRWFRDGLLRKHPSIRRYLERTNTDG